MVERNGKPDGGRDQKVGSVRTGSGEDPDDQGPGSGSLWQRVIGGMNAFGTLGIVFLMVIINADIIGRAVFSAPIRGVPEIVRLVIVAIVFLQLAHTLASGRLTRSTLGLDLMHRWRPRAARVMEAGFNLLGAGLFAIVVWAAWPMFLRSWSRGEFLGAQGVFTVPVWPVKGLVILGAAALAVQFVLMARRALTGGSRA